MIAFVACSGDDSSNDSQVLTYSVSINQPTCQGPKNSYCITEIENNRIRDWLDSDPVGTICEWTYIIDTNGGYHSGYFRSVERPAGDGVCD